MICSKSFLGWPWEITLLYLSPVLHVSHTLWTNKFLKKYSHCGRKTARVRSENIQGFLKSSLGINIESHSVFFHWPKEVIS